MTVLWLHQYKVAFVQQCLKYKNILVACFEIVICEQDFTLSLEKQGVCNTDSVLENNLKKKSSVSEKHYWI